MSREVLAEAIREEKALKVCARHDRTVFFDEAECPCCRIEKEKRYGKLHRPLIGWHK